GVSFSGGVGTIPGVLIGTLILQVINYGLTFIGVNPYLQFIISVKSIILCKIVDNVMNAGCSIIQQSNEALIMSFGLLVLSQAGLIGRTDRKADRRRLVVKASWD